MAKKAEQKIVGTEEAWESEVLGASASSAKLSDLIDQGDIDKSLGLKMISIRLQEDLLSSLKYIAKIHGLGYQPLIKQALRRFVDCEMKRIIREMAKRMSDEQGDNEDHDLDEPPRAAAG